MASLAVALYFEVLATNTRQLFSAVCSGFCFRCCSCAIVDQQKLASSRTDILLRGVDPPDRKKPWYCCDVRPFLRVLARLKRESASTEAKNWRLTTGYTTKMDGSAIRTVGRAGNKRRLNMDSFEYRFMMQIAMPCGFLTSYPANWWLLKAGLKEKM